MENVWMTSQGLELHENTFGDKQPIKTKVVFGSLVGQFVSFSSKNNALCFQTDQTLTALTLLKSNNVFTAKIENNSEVYQIKWAQYNYKVTESNESVYVSIWEQHNEEE
tara:strand:- start:118 stop:444 length:327 start_codon:yes stop_codon:yes gene_type:complete